MPRLDNWIIKRSVLDFRNNHARNKLMSTYEAWIPIMLVHYTKRENTSYVRY